MKLISVVSVRLSKVLGTKIIVLTLLCINKISLLYSTIGIRAGSVGTSVLELVSAEVAVEDCTREILQEHSQGL